MTDNSQKHYISIILDDNFRHQGSPKSYCYESDETVNGSNKASVSIPYEES